MLDVLSVPTERDLLRKSLCQITNFCARWELGIVQFWDRVLCSVMCRFLFLQALIYDVANCNLLGVQIFPELAAKFAMLLCSSAVALMQGDLYNTQQNGAGGGGQADQQQQPQPQQPPPAAAAPPPTGVSFALVVSLYPCQQVTTWYSKKIVFWIASFCLVLRIKIMTNCGFV